MRTHTTVATIASAALFILIAPTGQPAAIEIENDVGLEWSAGIAIPCSPPTLCSVEVSGAPRLLENPPSAVAGVTVTFINNGETVIHESFIKLRILDAASLKPLINWSAIVPRIEVGHEEVRSLALLLGTTGMLFLRSTDAVLAFGGTVEAEGGKKTALRIVVSGEGRELILDRVGDADGFQPGNALDVPPRSSALVHTLGLFEDGSETLSGELDEAGINRPVGFTHVFTAPSGRIADSTLRLDVRSDSSGIRNDYVVLDDGLGEPDGKRRGALIFLCHLLSARELATRGQTHTLLIDLERAPVTSRDAAFYGSPCSSSPALRSLTGLLRDGRLDVVVADDSAVDFSDLRITLATP